MSITERINRDEILKALERLVIAIDCENMNTEGATMAHMASYGCIICTVGTVPDRLNTGLCAYHHAIHIINRETP